MMCSLYKAFLGNSRSTFDREMCEQAPRWYLKHTCEFNGAALFCYLEIQWLCWESNCFYNLQG